MFSLRKPLLYTYAVLAHTELASSFLSSRIRANSSPAEIPCIEFTQAQTPTALRAETGAQALLLPPGILGPPEPLKGLKVGGRLDAFRALQYKDETEKVQFTIERVSRSPDIFRLGNFVTESECAQIQSDAEEIGMKVAETVTKDDRSSRKHCSVAWLSSNNNNGQEKADAISDLVSSTVNIFLSKDVLSHPSAGVEDLQVLKYGAGGEFVHHHDGEPRILTVIYYINGIGGTWFPLAHTNDNENKGIDGREPLNKEQALDLVKGLEPGKDGLLVKGIGSYDAADQEQNEHIACVNRGDAIAFYNYKDDGSAQLDWTALHCGLPTTDEEGTKWIANHWYRVNALADM